MKLIEQECSNCGAKIKKIDSKNYTCPYCGTSYIVEDLEDKKKVSKKQAKKPAVKPKTVTKQKPVAKPSNAPVTSNGNRTTPTTCGCLMLFMLLGLAFGLIATGISGGLSNNSNNSHIGIEDSDKQEDAFVNMVEAVFEKDYDDVTKDELQSVTQIVIEKGYESKVGEVSGSCIVNGKNVPFSCVGYVTDVSKKLYRFKNLESIVTKYSLYEEGLKGLDKLSSIDYSEHSLNSLVKILPYPENITTLKNVYASQEMSMISELPNLQVLKISLNNVKDISPLGELGNLEEIDLYVSGDLKDFSVLGKLTDLKSVIIYSSYLYSTDFVENLDNLEVLELNGCREVTSVAGLSGKTKLRRLVIVDCYDFADYAVINTLTNLEELKIYGNRADERIQWGNLKKIKSLTIRGFSSAYMLEGIKELPELEILWISQCYSLDSTNYIETLGQLDNLKSLSFTDMDSFDVSMVAHMDGLEKLYIKGVRSVKNAEKIFDAPNIKDVILFDEWIFMDFANVNQNDSLEKLTIRYCEFREGSNEAEFADNVGFLAKFPNLTELEIRGTKLENVDFVRDLPSLTKLDVTNNYVSDVSAVNDCPNIVELWCGDNVVTTAPEFNHPVDVHMDEESMWEYK